MFDSSKQKALKELLEVLGKGIDLLANENLDKDLYDAFENMQILQLKWWMKPIMVGICLISQIRSYLIIILIT